MQTAWKTLAVLASLVVAGVVGCCESQDAVTPSRATSSLSGLDLSKHVGQVIEGTVAEHVFTHKNDLPTAVAILEDEDIEKSCGCVGLELSARRVEPGETVTIRMRVNTGGKHGQFRVGAVVNWQTVDGTAWPMNLYLEGTAKAILTSQPGLVRFSSDEIAARTVKELAVFHAFDVDWSTLTTHIDPPYAELVGKEMHADHIKLFLRACPKSEAADFSATLRFAADLAVTNQDVKNCAITVPIQGSQFIDVQVSPRVVFANWSRESNKGSARFFVRGLALAEPTSVSSVSCDGFHADWAAKDVSSAGAATASRTIQVELKLSEPEDPAFDASQARCVRIGFAGGRSLEVPVYLVAHQERS